MPEQQRHMVGVDPGEAEAPAEPRAQAVRQALEAVQAAPEAERPAQVEGLGRALAALPRSEASARLLLELLSGDALAGLKDAGGGTARAQAVRALLRLGYPWALQVDPDDLAALRAEERGPGFPFRRLALWLAMVAALGGAGVLLAGKLSPRPRPPVTAPMPGR